MTGVCVVERIIPLCHYCHNFIHSVRLYMAAGVENSEQECVNILEHGFQILKRNGLKCFGGTLAVAEALGARCFGVEAAELKVNNNIGLFQRRVILHFAID